MSETIYSKLESGPIRAKITILDVAGFSTDSDG